MDEQKILQENQELLEYYLSQPGFSKAVELVTYCGILLALLEKYKVFTAEEQKNLKSFAHLCFGAGIRFFNVLLEGRLYVNTVTGEMHPRGRKAIRIATGAADSALAATEQKCLPIIRGHNLQFDHSIITEVIPKSGRTCQDELGWILTTTASFADLYRIAKNGGDKLKGDIEDIVLCGGVAYRFLDDVVSANSEFDDTCSPFPVFPEEYVPQLMQCGDVAEALENKYLDLGLLPRYPGY